MVKKPITKSNHSHNQPNQPLTKKMKKIFTLYYRELFLTNRLFMLITCSVVLFLFAFFFAWLGVIPELFFYSLAAVFLLDCYLLYSVRKGVFAKRHAPERLSNSDENELGIYIENWYNFNVNVGIIDEIPVQFQKRDIWFKTSL